MKRANSLSRCLDQQVRIERDNKNRVLVKKEQLEVRTIQVIKVVIKGIDLLEKIRKSEAKDDEIVKAIEEIKQVDIKMLRDKKWQEENKLMLKDKKVCPKE